MKKSPPASPPPAPLPDDKAWHLPAVIGVQGMSLYYLVTVHHRHLRRLLRPMDPKMLAEERVQRLLTKARLPGIAKYVIDNRRSYTFPPLLGLIDGAAQFFPADAGPLRRVGILEIPFSVPVYLFDGAHRTGGLLLAMEKDETLADESIGIALYSDVGLQRAQMRFHDVNRFPVRVSGSLGVLYDHRSKAACLTKAVVAAVPTLKRLVDPERTPSAKSNKLFSLATMCAATTAMGLDLAEATDFWSAVSLSFEPWQDAAKGLVSAATLRDKFVHAHAVGLLGIARAFRGNNWQVKVHALGEVVDWRKSAPEWEGRAMLAGRMSKTSVSVGRTANRIKQCLGWELGPEDRRVETSVSLR